MRELRRLLGLDERYPVTVGSKPSMSQPMRNSTSSHFRRGIKGAALAALLIVLGLAPAPSDTGSGSDLLVDYLPAYPHQAYGYALAQTRAAETQAGRQWLAAAERALLVPQPVELPLRWRGRFEAEAADALGIQFDVEPPRQVIARLAVDGDSPVEVFLDLFRSTGQGIEHFVSAAPVAAADGAAFSRELRFDAFEPASYVVRLQSQMLRGASYELSIEVQAPLAFPVSGYDRRAIQSGFGADRDGGRRAHRGVDIFAARGTEAVAAMDAWVSRVETTRRGGNVIWLQPLFGNMRLYYAHLDEHLVEAGQFVAAGQRLGLVGNTGNAITTPPHLHFGVYLRRQGRRGGARDPMDFLY